MTLILKQSTSIDIRMGPFVDVGDGFTPETGVTIAGSDEAEVLKANGAATVAMTGTLAAVTNADGWYDYTVAAGDVDTVGEVVFVMQDDTVYLPVFVRGQVIEEAVYDAMYGASAGGPLQPTTAGRTLDVAADGTAGLDWANIGSPTTAQTLSGTTVGTTTTNTDMRGTDSALLAASAPTNFGDLSIQVTTGFVSLLAATQASIDAIEADTNELQTDWTNAGRLDAILDLIAADVVNLDGAAMRGTDNAALASVLGALTDAAAAGDPTTTETVMQYVKQLINTLEGAAGIPTFPAEAAPGNAVSLAEVIRAIHVDVTGLNGDVMRGTDSAATAAALTTAQNDLDIITGADGANLLSGTQTSIDAIETDTGTTIPGTITTLQADTDDIQTRLPAALVSGLMDSNVGAISDDTTAADRLEAMMDGIIIGQVNDASATTTDFAADNFTEATDDHFNGRLITFISGALTGQQTDITDYDAAGGVQGSQQFTVTALTEAPGDGVFFVVH